MYPDLNDPVFLQHTMVQAHRAAIHEELIAAGLHEIGHPMLLSILCSTHDGVQCSQRELADRLHVTPPAIAVSLKSLEKSGYLRRERTEGDARRNHIILTDKGVIAMDGCATVITNVYARMMEGFSTEETQLLQQFRQRMIDNLKPNVAKERTETNCSNCL